MCMLFLVLIFRNGAVKKAKVARSRDCTLCRECVRGDGWDKRVQLCRVKDHFICELIFPDIFCRCTSTLGFYFKNDPFTKTYFIPSFEQAFSKQFFPCEF